MAANLRTWLQEWDRQPQGEFSLRSRFARPGAFVFAGEAGPLYLSSAGGVWSSATLQNGAAIGAGRRLVTTAANQRLQSIASVPALGATDPATYILRVTVASWSGGFVYVFSPTSNSTGSIFLRHDSVGGEWGYLRAGGQVRSGKVLSLGSTYTLVMSHDGTSLRSFTTCDDSGNIDYQEATSTGNATAAGAVSLGCYFSGALGSPASFDLAAFLPNLYLSETEAKAVARNPYQIFTPRRIIVPVPAAGATTYTLSAATFVPGSITASGVTARVTVTEA